MYQYFLLIFLSPFLTKAQLPIVTDLPDPVIILVGPTGAGKSSLANALLGCDPQSPNCLFQVCDGMDSCTKSTTYGTGSWLGDGQNFTVVDSPGFGDSDLEGDELMEEMLDVLKNTIKHCSTILLVLKGDQTRFDEALLNMLTKTSSIFGTQWWNFMVIGVSFWKFDQESIDGREEHCQYYPTSCKDEAWFMREINTQLQDKFHIEKNFTFAFIDSYSQVRPNDEDPVQQEHFQEEAGVLWDETTSRNSSFVFKGIDDVLDENAEMRERIKWLEDVLTNNITMLMSRMNATEKDVTENKAKIGQIEEDVMDNGIDVGNVQGHVDRQQTDIDTLYGNVTTVDGKVDTVDGRVDAVDWKVSVNEGAISDLVLASGLECGYHGATTMMTRAAPLLSAGYPSRYPGTSSSSIGLSCYFSLVPLPGKSVHLDWTYFLLYGNSAHWLYIHPDGEDGVSYHGDNVPPTRTYGRDQAVQIKFYTRYVDMSAQPDKYRFRAMFTMV